jgi:hypothetical protein
MCPHSLNAVRNFQAICVVAVGFHSLFVSRKLAMITGKGQAPFRTNVMSKLIETRFARRATRESDERHFLRHPG